MSVESLFFLILCNKTTAALKELIVEIARILLSKNIGFCLYRFPLEDNFRLAIDRKHLPHKEKKKFWIAPFTKESTAQDFYLSVVDEKYIDTSFLKQVQALQKEEKTETDLPQETTRQEYFEQIEHYLSDIRKGKLDKAILSRVVYAPKPENFDVLSCYEHIESAYPKALAYVFYHRESGLWMGATPELLLKKQEEDIFTMALAGTQVRREDERYHWREKEIDEHEWVSDHIAEVFLAKGYALKEREERKTVESGPVAHLQTAFVFNEKVDSSSLKQLIGQLHPTPAIGGWPVEASLQCIHRYECYDRKYYAGILGEWSGEHHADLYVNLRCMQIGGDKIAIFVGGGITAASDPEEEWEETCIKSKTMADKILI